MEGYLYKVLLIAGNLNHWKCTDSHTQKINKFIQFYYVTCLITTFH